MIQTGGDPNLENQRVVLVASMIERLKNNFGHIIIDELFVNAHKTASALTFLCLIMELYRKDNVPLLMGVDNDV